MLKKAAFIVMKIQPLFFNYYIQLTTRIWYVPMCILGKCQMVLISESNRTKNPLTPKNVSEPSEEFLRTAERISSDGCALRVYNFK